MTEIVAERIGEVLPDFADAAWADGSFRHRAARWLAGQRGVAQFIDVRHGRADASDTAEAVRRAREAAQVVTIDIRELDAALDSAGLRALIDFSEPVALLMTSALHFLPAAADPWGLVRRCVGRCVPGSYLAVSHATADRLAPGQAGADARERAGTGESVHLRRRDEIERFFQDLELVPPYHGAPARVCFVGEWGAEDPDAADGDGSRLLYCGVARLP